MKAYPPGMRARFNATAEQLWISSITLGELHFRTEKSTLRCANRLAIEHFTARLEVLPFTAAAGAHHGQIRAELERTGRPACVYDMLIGAHARSEALVVVTKNLRKFTRMPGLLVENWVYCNASGLIK